MLELPATLGDGRYELDDVIGAGGMAIVVRARDRELDRRVAIKLLAENLAADEGIRKRFVQESRLAARLSHPNIVRVYDAGDDERPYFVMEYVEGESVAQQLRDRGRFEWPRAVEIVAQACAGIEHAHEAGVVHRDVKPANLLLDGDGAVKVADFGIAALEDGTRLTATNIALGSLPYLAPERLRESNEVSPAADVYGLGVVLYELTAGCLPFRCDSLEAVLQRSPEEPPPRLADAVPDIPESVDELVRRALACDPEARPGSARAFAAALPVPMPGASPLAEVLSGTNTEATADPVTETRPVAPPWRTRRRSIAIAAAVVAAMVALFLGLMAVVGNGGGNAPTASAAPIDGSGGPAQRADELAHWLQAQSTPPAH